MNIVIRTDASVKIGTGHVMRCLTLAKQLKRHGAKVMFVCREFEGNSISYIRDQGISVCSLPSIDTNESDLHWVKEHWKLDSEETVAVINELDDDVDLLIVDHYGLDSRWESSVRNAAKNIMVIDDLADRMHDCDLLLDQNYYLNMEERYKGLVPVHCGQMLGPNYILLRDEFVQVASKPRVRTGEIKNILVFFGGTDPTGETIKTLKAIKELDIPEIRVNVVVGAANPRQQEVEQLCSEMPNTNYHCHVSNMAELMWEADLAIGAGGATTWERCFMGLPALVIVVADNQRVAAKAMARQGIIISLGDYIQVNPKDIKQKVLRLLKNPNILEEIRISCQKVLKPSQINLYATVGRIYKLKSGLF